MGPDRLLRKVMSSMNRLTIRLLHFFQLCLLLIISVIPIGAHAQTSQFLPAINYILLGDEPATPVPEEDVYLELTWSTLGDPDETDTGPDVGSDLDLHYAHTNAIHAAQPDLDIDGFPDPWYELTYDTFWFNPNPNWANVDLAVDDDPHMIRDDTDGAGPEIITHNNPENTIYHIGVHAFNDHDFGDSTATISIWVSGIKVYSSSALLTEKDMWWVGEIDGQTGQFTPHVVGMGSHRITPNYNNPLF